MIFNFINEYKQIGKKFNWYDCTLIQISLEKDKIIEGFDLCLMLLGFGVVIRINLW